jgi:hypothetical protein
MQERRALTSQAVRCFKGLEEVEQGGGRDYQGICQVPPACKTNEAISDNRAQQAGEDVKEPCYKSQKLYCRKLEIENVSDTSE